MPGVRRPEGFGGANERTRTAGLRITSALLYHLSYIGLVRKILDYAGLFKPFAGVRFKK